MNSHNIFNPNDFDTIETSPQMYYVEVNSQNITETAVESQAIPLNMILNPHGDQLYTFIKDRPQNEQLCVYMEPEPTDILDDQTLLNYINNQRFLPNNGNTLTLPTTTEVSSSNNLLCNNIILTTPSPSGKSAADIDVEDNAKETKVEDNAKNRKRTASKFQKIGIVKTKTSSEARDMIEDAAKSKTPLFLLKNGDNIKHIDVSDRDKSNWFCLLTLGTQSTANVWLYEEDNKLYGITVQPLTAQTTLALGYSKQYSEDHKLPPGLPILDLTQDLPEEQRRWWCYKCHRALPTASQLQVHVDSYHKEKITSTGRYRCRHCTRTFGRRFTLKRHMARYCYKKPEKPQNSNKTNTTPEVRLDTSLNAEDNRLPSDESLQNYTNGLDFSTNLFDTDRMPSLDISGSSRSEIEFNSYGIGLDLELGKLASEYDKTGNENPNKKQSASSEPLTMLISCPYCKQTILREKKREHLRDCPERKFECESCGVTFNSMEKLAQHINSAHPEKTAQSKPALNIENDQSSKERKACEYKCDKCQFEFKRRGMLVNHMWRVHKVSAQVPLQRRVRHYPCGACPKLYRSAAKRDTHRAAHHPGADLIRGQAIESGKRACEPAACSACPRQYATRAKLLQHMRQHHPQLAPPLKKSATNIV